MFVVNFKIGAKLHLLNLFMSLSVQDQTKKMPVLVRADIQSGQLEAFGRSFALPIRGSGYVSVAYLDDCLRVLRDSRGGVAVQLREDVLARLVGG